MNNKISFIAVVVLIVLITGGYYFYSHDNLVEIPKEVVKNSGFGVGQKAIVYKSPTCGCCVGYADELEKQGFEVEVVLTEDTSSIKDGYGIPSDKQSCHTVVIGNYFIEGHTPMEAVKKLLKEKPEIDGIGLPRMPAGTPGMGGTKRAPYEVYKIKDGEVSEFITI